MTLIWISNYGTTGKFEYKGENREFLGNKQKNLEAKRS